MQAGSLGYKKQRQLLDQAASQIPDAGITAQAMDSAKKLIANLGEPVLSRSPVDTDFERNNAEILEYLRSKGREGKSGSGFMGEGYSSDDFSRFPANAQYYRDRPDQPVDLSPQGEMANLILDTARAMQMDPIDLATAISYETAGTMSPTQIGPVTKQWGQHRGLIQFGEPQAKQYGVDWNDPLRSQLGEGKAVHKYFLDRGWKPGMSGLDLYSIINAGSPGRYNAVDGKTTVRQKWENEMHDHRTKARRMFGLT